MRQRGTAPFFCSIVAPAVLFGEILLTIAVAAVQLAVIEEAKMMAEIFVRRQSSLRSTHELRKA